MNTRNGFGLLPLLGILAGCASTGSGPGATGCTTTAWDPVALDQVMDSAAALAALEGAWAPPSQDQGSIRARLSYDSTGVFTSAHVWGVDSTSADRMAGVLSAAVRPSARWEETVYLRLGDVAGPRLEVVTSVRQCTPQILDRTGLSRRATDVARELDLPRGSRYEVVAHLLVQENGEVVQGRIFRSAGRADIDGVALEALMRTRFTPATVDGVPVPVWIALPIGFAGPTVGD